MNDPSVSRGPAPSSTPTAAAPTAPAGLGRLNAMTPAEADSTFLTVCGSRRWARAMAAARPFSDAAALLAKADAAWFALDHGDWLEAFSHHPRIGESKLDAAKFARTAEQSSREQSGMAGAPDEVRQEFVVLNAEYEHIFGHVFLICATGKTGPQMLDHLRARLRNTAELEILNAAKEQALITRIRLERLVNS